MTARRDQATADLAALTALPLLLYAFRHALVDLSTAWQTDEYSHGPFIPVIAALLGWRFLSTARPRRRPSWWGLPCLLAGAMLQLIAQFSAFGMAAQYGLLLSLTGLLLAWAGVKAARAVAPALAYLVFAIPLPHLLQADVSQQLQLVSSSLGVGLLDLLGIPVFQEGNVIDLGGYRLQVVEACSGLRYLFPLMSFGYLVALLLQDRWWKRVTLFLSTIPISIGLNALRIGFIGVTVDRWGRAAAEGLVHAFEGWAVFLLCLLLLMAEGGLLLRMGIGGQFRYDYLIPARGALFSGTAPRRGPPLMAFIMLIVLAVLSSTGFAQRQERIPPHAALAGFPLQLGAWQGKPDRLPDDVLAELQLSDYWLADYRQGDDPAKVNVYVAYYDSQRVGTTTHSPSNCIPGGGWRIDTRGTVTVPLESGHTLTVTRMVIRQGPMAELVYYWFDERGRELTETTWAKLALLKDSILLHRSDGALVRLITPLPPLADANSADERLRQFLLAVHPALKSFIPGADPVLNPY